MSNFEGGNRKERANEIPWLKLNFKWLKESDSIVEKCLQCDKILKNRA